MNIIAALENESFIVGKTNLNIFLNRPHRLNFGLIFICGTGKAIITTEVINYDIKTNTKVSLLPGTIFMLQEASNDFEVTFIAFSLTLFEEANYHLEPTFVEFLRQNPVYQIPFEKVDHLRGNFKFLNHIYRDHENRFRYEITRNYLQCMFWETYDKTHRLFEHMKTNSSFHYLEIFKKFISLIHQHSKEQREVSFYANKLCITPRYLTLITRKVTQNKSAKDLINSHVILEIKVLLQSTELAIQEIAHQLNFPDQSYLGRYFKRYTGKSPIEYRLTFKLKS